MAQLVEHILGKDEVPGPNPGSSSRHPRSYGFGALVLYEKTTPFGVFFHIQSSIVAHLGCRELLLCRGTRFVRKNRTQHSSHLKPLEYRKLSLRPKRTKPVRKICHTAQALKPHAPTPTQPSKGIPRPYGGETPGFAPATSTGAGANSSLIKLLIC